MTHHRAQGLLGDDGGQDHVIVGDLEHRLLGRQARGVRGPDVAAAGLVRRPDLVRTFHHHRGVAHVVGAEEITQVELGGGARDDADAGAIEVEPGLHAQVLTHHEALTVVVIHAGELEAQLDVAVEGPGRGPGQHVDLARLELRKAGLGGAGDELDRLGIAEDTGGYGAADVDIEAVPLPLVVRALEPGQTGADAAQQVTPGLDVVERPGHRGRGDQCHRGSGGKCAGNSHIKNPPCLFLIIASYTALSARLRQARALTVTQLLTASQDGG